MPKVSSDDLKAFGLAVKRARSLKGWTLDELGAAIVPPVGKSLISKVERGKKEGLNSRTVGRIIKALTLSEEWIDTFLDADATEDGDETRVEQNADRMLEIVAKDGDAPSLSEELLIQLANSYAEGDYIDLDGAYRSLRVALQTARDMRDRAALPDNTDASVTAIRAEVNRINEADGPEAGGAYLAEALAQKSAEMGALLDLGVQQARLENDPKAAARYLVDQLQRERPRERMFDALRTLQDAWYAKGRDAGLAYEAAVAIHLAETTVHIAVGAGQRGAGLNDLGIALRTLGDRESGTARLEKAVTA